jgi:hypothetical protein
MVRLSMVLLGHDFVRKRWSALALTGIVWGAAGVGIFIDALDGVLYFPLHFFGYLLLLEALILLLVPAPQAGTAAALRKARGLAFLLLGLLIVDRQHAAGLILAVLFGGAFLLDGGFQVGGGAGGAFCRLASVAAGGFVRNRLWRVYPRAIPDAV